MCVLLVSVLICKYVSFITCAFIYPYLLSYVCCDDILYTWQVRNDFNKDVYIYLNKLESIMRALSDALPTGHRAMANATLQLHFGCGRATPPLSHSHNWPSGRMQNFLFKIGQKSFFFFANKDPKTNFDDWMILQKHVLSFKCNDFFKMANLKAISSSATLTLPWDGTPPWKGPPGGQKPRKRDSSLSGHWMGHLLSYSLSGGHDGAMLPINLRGLNGPLASHFIFSSHMYFSLNTPTHYWSPMPN